MSSTATKEKGKFLTYSYTIGLCVMEGRGFSYPSDTGIGRDGRLWVANRGVDMEGYRQIRGTLCNLDSEYFGDWGSFGEGDGQFVSPTAVALDSRGQVYVSDEFTNRITIFDSQGKFVSNWGAAGTGEGELTGPAGIAFDSEDNIYVSDHLNHRVQKFTSDGRFLLCFGSPGAGDGQFNLPWGLTVDAKGEVYVADWGNDRIQRFTAGGGFIRKYGTSGRSEGEFYRPSSVAVDGEGYIYVADWGNERLQVLDADGELVQVLRGEATLSAWAQDFFKANTEEAAARAKSDLEPDIDFFTDDPHERSSHIEKLFWSPVSVKLAADGKVCVTERDRHRIQIYERA